MIRNLCLHIFIIDNCRTWVLFYVHENCKICKSIILCVQCVGYEGLLARGGPMGVPKIGRYFLKRHRWINWLIPQQKMAVPKTRTRSMFSIILGHLTGTYRGLHQVSPALVYSCQFQQRLFAFWAAPASGYLVFLQSNSLDEKILSSCG